MALRSALFSLVIAVCVSGCGDEDDPPKKSGGSSEEECPAQDGEGTEHQGTIDADETWSADDGPHIVTFDVNVRGSTLTIEPCATVRIDKGYHFTIGATSGDEAAIVARGEPERRLADRLRRLEIAFVDDLFLLFFLVLAARLHAELGEQRVAVDRSERPERRVRRRAGPGKHRVIRSPMAERDVGAACRQRPADRRADSLPARRTGHQGYIARQFHPGTPLPGAATAFTAASQVSKSPYAPNGRLDRGGMRVRPYPHVRPGGE